MNHCYLSAENFLVSKYVFTAYFSITYRKVRLGIESYKVIFINKFIYLQVTYPARKYAPFQHPRQGILYKLIENKKANQ